MTALFDRHTNAMTALSINIDHTMSDAQFRISLNRELMCRHEQITTKLGTMFVIQVNNGKVILLLLHNNNKVKRKESDIIRKS